MRAKVHVLDQPTADEVIEGRFSASDGNGELARSSRIAFVSRRDGTTRWLDFDKLAPPLPSASLAATVAASVADGKPHVVRVLAGNDAGVHEIATATLHRPPE